MSNAGDLKISANCNKAQMILAILDWSELACDWLVGEASWRPRLPLEEGCRQGRGWPEVGGDRGWLRRLRRLRRLMPGHGPASGIRGRAVAGATYLVTLATYRKWL